MGGIWVRPDDLSTDVQGLYAVGEASSGLHGANRLGGNSLIELIVGGRIAGAAAARYAAGVTAQPRSAAALACARDDLNAVVALNGPESPRPLQRAIRDTMTACAGVVRDANGLTRGLAELAETEARLPALGVNPDLAGFQDVAHVFDLRAAVLAARATLEAALERRETRGCHNRSDYPIRDERLRVNLVWSGPGHLTRESIAAIPPEIQRLVHDVTAAGKLLE
jgi:succinate dehydrogenase / fumarate reductase flavoprotein subunit